MHKTLPLILIALILSIFFATGFFQAEAITQLIAPKNDVIKGKIIVKYKDNVPSKEKGKTVRDNGAKVTAKIDKLNVEVYQVSEKNHDKVLKTLAKNKNVEYAESDYLAVAFEGYPSDEHYLSKQWGLENRGQDIVGVKGTLDADIDAEDAWLLETGGVVVAILDTGIDQDHPDLLGKIMNNVNFSDSKTVDDLYGHGTHVGGTVAAVTDNSIGVAGGCPSCTLLNVKVLNDSGAGSHSSIANGIIWAADRGAKVVNMSLGSSQKSRTLENAVNYAWNKGVVLVAAAGNSANSSMTYPAAYKNVIAVAATNNKDQKASFSSYGSKWVSVAAPGENIYSTFPNHDFVLGTKYGRSKNYDFASGTSMATPMTAATLGLIWSSDYGTTAQSVRNRLESTTDKITGTGKFWINGRINAGKALAR